MSRAKARWGSVGLATKGPWAYHRAMELAPRIVADPTVCHGQAVVAGTRVPVAVVVGSLAGGMTVAEVAREYDLAEADVRAALKYAADLTARESIRPLPAA